METGAIDSGADDTGTSDGGEDTGDPPEDTDPSEPIACYLGPSRDHAACLDVVDYDPAWGEDYAYPDAYDGSAQYIAPARYVDLAAVDPRLEIAPNFVLEEYMAEWKGRWGVMQTHVVDAMQDVRDEVGGPVSVNSGYRSPEYNAGVGGVTYSRHQYGDAVDLDVEGMSADELADICDRLGADYVATYSTGHTHCDWRDHPLDPAFYDLPSAMAAAPAPRPVHVAELVFDGVSWSAPATGFDDGEPERRWVARSADGSVLSAATGETFEAPDRAARVEVVIGRQVGVEAEIP
ncbi:MAG: D-Ala-D-Ala carboxypeptidase family metallohydrolase [Myxococcota bacterium]